MDLNDELKEMLETSTDETPAESVEIPPIETLPVETHVTPPVKTPATPPVDDRDSIIAGLRSQIETLSAKSTTTPEVPVVPTPPPGTPPATQDELDVMMENIDFEDLFASKENFFKVLKAVRDNAMAKGAEIAYTKSIGSIPEIVRTNITHQASLTKAVDEFYTNNEDLKPFKKVVAVVVEELAAKSPELTFDKIAEAAAVETRVRLGLTKPVQTSSSSTGGRPPANPRTGGGARPLPVTPLKEGSLEKQIADMIAAED